VSLPLVIWLHVDETSPESLKVIQCRKHNWSGLICSMQVFSVILQKENWWADILVAGKEQ